jgi:hypothetical protein
MIKNSKWAIEEAPADHKNMIFFSPDCRDYGFYFLKEVSCASILNDPSDSICSTLKVLRDSNSLFFKKISKIKLNLKTINEEKKKKFFKNDLEKAVNNYVLSKNKNLVSEFKVLSERMEKNNTFIYNYSLLECLSLFNNENLFIYYSPALKDIKDKNHFKLLDILIKHYSKIIVHAYDNKLYKKYFKEWNRKRKPNQKNKVKIECIWKNF